MAVKKVVKAVAKKVVAKKVVPKKVEELVVDGPTTEEMLAYELAKVQGNYVMKPETYGIMATVGEYNTDTLNYHLDRIEGARVSKQELMAIGASLFR